MVAKDTSVLCCMEVHEDCTYDEVYYECACNCHGWLYRVKWWFRSRFMEER